MCDGMKNMLASCHKIVTYYHHRLVATNKINNEVMKFDSKSGNEGLAFKSLNLSNAKKWNGDYFMVERLLECNEAILTEISKSGSGRTFNCFRVKKTHLWPEFCTGTICTSNDETLQGKISKPNT